jgi:hypothetical protein
MTTMIIQSALLVVLAALAIAALPWTNKEVEESATAWRTLGRLIRRWLCR